MCADVDDDKEERGGEGSFVFACRVVFGEVEAECWPPLPSFDGLLGKHKQPPYHSGLKMGNGIGVTPLEKNF